MNRKLTQRQINHLKRIAKEGESSIAQDIASQLQKRGLIFIYHTRERYEWGRKIATMAVVGLTTEGQKVASTLSGVSS